MRPDGWQGRERRGPPATLCFRLKDHRDLAAADAYAAHADALLLRARRTITVYVGNLARDPRGRAEAFGGAGSDQRRSLAFSSRFRIGRAPPRATALKASFDVGAAGRRRPPVIPARARGPGDGVHAGMRALPISTTAHDAGHASR
jgi:hypothetical protein